MSEVERLANGIRKIQDQRLRAIELQENPVVSRFLGQDYLKAYQDALEYALFALGVV